MFSQSSYPRGERPHRGPMGHGPGRCRDYAQGPRGEFGGRGFGPMGHGGPRGRGRKARRGDIRTAALLLLAEGPRNGYQIMQDVQERSGDLWRPSPGSVYPTLSQLEDEGLIRSEEIDGRRQYAITDEGTKVLQDRPQDARAPWEQDGDESGSDLQALGIRRAHAIQDVLLKGTTIDPVRVFLISDAKQPPPGTTVRLELALK